MTGRQAGSEVVIHPVPNRFAHSLSVQIEPAPTTKNAGDPAADAAWARRCAQNPRLFNGSILIATQLSLDDGIIRCVRDTYKRLALRDELGLDIAILSITTLLEARDESGDRCFLMGCRGKRTRSYPGLWELGPAGGLDAPPIECDSLDHAAFIAQVNTELREETGICEHIQIGEVIAVVFDPIAGSYDIVIRVELDTSIEQLVITKAEHAWEYEATRWVSWSHLDEVLNSDTDRLIGPTRALLGWLGNRTN